MQKQGDFVEQAFGRFGALDDDRFRVAPQALLVVKGQVMAGIDDDRREGIGVFLTERFQQ